MKFTFERGILLGDDDPLAMLVPIGAAAEEIILHALNGYMRLMDSQQRFIDQTNVIFSITGSHLKDEPPLMGG